MIAATHRRRARGGWTLIETLVVCAIISLLAGIVIWNVARGRDGNNVRTSSVNLKNIATAAQAFSADELSYPNGGSDPATFTADGQTFLAQAVYSPGNGAEYTVTYLQALHAYVILDPATYSPASLSNVTRGDPSTGALLDPPAPCAGACTHLGYGKSGGLFAY